MTTNGILQILLYLLVIVLITKPIGLYMACVFNGERTWLTPIFKPVERFFYRLFGTNEEQDMRWTTYAFAMLMFSAVGLVLSYILLRLQHVLPLNPRHFGPKQMPADLAFNTSASFTTNTNWQNYSPEVTISYFSNMVALAIHNWMSAACGIAIALALVRGLARRSAQGIGNFWVDVTRCTLYILIPICFFYSIFLVWQGIPQNFSSYTKAATVEGQTQVIPQGPIASQESIKMLGTNGGGFLNASSAHPYENPTPLTNFIEIISIFAIPAGMTYLLGKMVGNVKQGWALFAAMSVLFLGGAFTAYHFEQKSNPTVEKLGVMTADTGGQPGGNMEGKETRFGIAGTALFATVTTDASCGAVNGMHDSFTPLGGMVPLFNIMTGEVIFGGVGAGLYGMLMMAIIAVFIAGLMVGRTPEYVGKKIEQYEVKMAMLAVLILAADILFFTAAGANVDFPKDEKVASSAWNRWPGGAYGATDTTYGEAYNNVNNSGAHGFAEILYQYSSQTGNNGSAFAGLTGNTPFYNLTGGIAMLIGRFLMIIPLLGIAGSLAKKKFIPETAGTFPTDSGTFVVLLVGVVVIVGALTYFPALSLGPIVEHFQMLAGKTF